MTNNEQVRNVVVRIDEQNDFVIGSLAVPDGEQIIQPLNEVSDSARENGGQVALTGDKHPKETPHFTKWIRHCEEGTWGAEHHQGVDIHSEDIIIVKGTGDTDGYSGWEGVSKDGQTLESIITPRTPEERVQAFLGGLATEYCVASTGIDVATYFKDDERVTVYLLRDAIRAINLQPGDEDRALAAMQEAKIIAISCLEARQLIEETSL